VLFLERGAAAARSVAKLRVHRHFGGAPSMRAGGEPDWGLGTGWLLGPDLLVTNFHVIAARSPREDPVAPADFDLQAAATQADFDFYADGAALTTVTAQGLVASDPTLDYAVLRVAIDRPPLRLRTSPLLRPPTSALRERVNVLQHPNGNAMRLGFRNNFVVTGVAERLSYLTDTAGGSSGSPIFDDAWEVAGLHRGWSTIKGTPVEVWGKEIRQENYGTPIGALLADVAAKGAAVHAEILAGQG
jgi:V8-like Glu-specific endopeptidase